MTRWIRLAFTVFVTVCAALGSLAPTEAQPPCRDFAYGNAGFASGYSMAVTRGSGWSGRWGTGYSCLPRPVCAPRICQPCSPCRPWSGCYPPRWGCGAGYGSSWYSSTQTFYLAPPANGGAMFFSGGIVPWPVPYAVPIPYAVPMPWLGSGAAGGVFAGSSGVMPASRATTVAPRPSPRPRASVAVASPPSARARALRLVAAGDRHLVKSKGDHPGLIAAATSYRQAAVAAKDDPEIHIRHAIALAALGRRGEADAAAGRAAALDGRLARGTAEVDPTAPSSTVARGMVILREIEVAIGEDNMTVAETVAVLADRWVGRPSGPLAAIAAGDSSAP